MTDPSSGDRDDRPTADGQDEAPDGGDRPSGGDGRSSDRSNADGPVSSPEADGPDHGFDFEGTTVETRVSDASTSDATVSDTPVSKPPAKEENDDPLVAVAAAIGVGVLGPLIALAGGIGVFAFQAVAGIEFGLVGRLLVTLFVGQYVAFAGLGIAYLAWRGFDRHGIISYLGVRWPSLKELGLVVVGWVVIIVSVMGISILVQLLGADTAANQSAELAIDNPNIIPVFILASFLVIGPCEEILYRGVVQGRLREALPAAPAIVIASAVFALIHVMALTGGLSGRLTTVAILFFPSLVFGIVYEYTENIVVPSLLHGLHNAVIFTALYVTVRYADEFEQFAEAGALLMPF